jgi:hypothetical protein
MKVNPQIGLKVPISNRIPALAADRHAGPGGGRKRLLPEAQDVEVVAFDLVCPCDEIGNIVHDVKEPARQAGLLFRMTGTRLAPRPDPVGTQFFETSS